MPRALLAWLAVSLFAATAHANGTLTGKVELPSTAPERPPPATKGFLDRVENPLAPVKAVPVATRMIVVLTGGDVNMSPPQVVIELLGESFSRRVVAAPAGAEVVIKNLSKSARTLVAAEDPKLIPQGPINPTGPKSFRVPDVDKIYTIGDKDAPHLVLKLVVVGSQFIGYPDESGRFDIAGVPPGTYKLKIWYGDGWLDRPDDSVEVKDKGKTEFNPKVSALGAPAGKK
jgi:Polysaccharide lyase family 4, domain II